MSDEQPKGQDLVTQSEGRLTRGQAWGRVQQAPTRDLSVFAYEPSDLQGAVALSQILCRTALVPEFLRGKPDETLMVLMDGRERGLTAMQSLRMIHPFESRGKVSVAYAADLLTGLVFRSGFCEDWVIVEMSEQRAAIKTQRKGSSEATTIEYTIDDAKRANLLGKPNWQNDPKAMLLARCKTRACRAVYPDIVAGMYTEDELGVMVEAAPPPVERKLDAIVKNVTATRGSTAQMMGRGEDRQPYVDGQSSMAEEAMAISHSTLAPEGGLGSAPQPWGDDSADPVIESEIVNATEEWKPNVQQLIKLAQIARLGGGKEDDEAALRSLAVREFKCRLESLTDKQVVELTAMISEG